MSTTMSTTIDCKQLVGLQCSAANPACRLMRQDFFFSEWRKETAVVRGLLPATIKREYARRTGDRSGDRSGS